MISVEKALNLILEKIQRKGEEKVDLLTSLGRILAEDLYSTSNIPPWDNSAMDGYALRWEDIRGATKDHPSVLEVIEDLPAGYLIKTPVQAGGAVRIMTGAPLPPGTDTVVRFEDTKAEGNMVKIFEEVEKGENVRKAGEDLREGHKALAKGTRIRPPEIGLMASMGRSFVKVYQKISVAILSTGDELIDVDECPSEGKIINSNSYSLAAQVKECGGIPIQLGIAKDVKGDLEEKLKQGLSADIILSSGGVSMGDYDYVKDVLKDLGTDVSFWKVAMKPGQPLVFGTINGKPIFGLPGNPVSAMVSFEQFVRPSILKMAGYCQIFRPILEAIISEPIEKKPGKKHFIRGYVKWDGKDLRVSFSTDQGSGVLRSMVEANCLIVLAEDKTKVQAGEKVKVQILDDSFFYCSQPNY